MNKHFIGLIIFSFIVGISAIIAGFFIQMPQMPTLDPVRVSNENPYIYSGRTFCPNKRKKMRLKDYSDLASAKVSQAVFDLDKKQLDTEFTIERANDSTETVNVALHFFVNDRYGVQHIATEVVKLNPNFDIGDKAVTAKISSFKWLNNLESHENLYIMPEVISDEYNYSNYPPTFDSTEATAVLLSPGTVAR